MPVELFLRHETADQRIAIGVGAGRWQPDQHVADGNVRARQHCIALYGAHREARQIVILCRVHAGHFGGFSADQRATGLLTAFGDTGHDSAADLNVELAGREIV